MARPTAKDIARNQYLLGIDYQPGGRIDRLKRAVKKNYPTRLVAGELALVVKALIVAYGPEVLVGIGKQIFDAESTRMGFCPHCGNELPPDRSDCQFCQDWADDLVKGDDSLDSEEE